MDPIDEDYLSLRRTAERKVTRFEVFGAFLNNRGFRATYIYRKRIKHLQRHHRVRKLFWESMNAIFISGNVYISAESIIDGGLVLHHPYSITIGKCRIGRRCNINQNVTIGHNFDKNADGRDYPVIEDNVWILPGAVVLGSINIGSNVMIGANAVVTRDVQDDCVVAGVPAKVIASYDWARFHQYPNRLATSGHAGGAGSFDALKDSMPSPPTSPGT